MSELEKPFLKKSEKTRKKNQKSMSKCIEREQKTTNEKRKFDSNKKTRPRTNYERIVKTI